MGRNRWIFYGGSLDKNSHQCLNGSIKRNEPEREGEGETGFDFCDVLFAQIYIRCCFLTRLLLTLFWLVSKPPFGIARLSYVDFL